MVQGTNDTLVPPQVGRRFAARLRQTSNSPVAYLELPRTQHAFDVLVSIRSRHTSLGVVRFLEGVRARVGALTPPGSRGHGFRGGSREPSGRRIWGAVLDTGPSF